MCFKYLPEIIILSFFFTFIMRKSTKYHIQPSLITCIRILTVKNCVASFKWGKFFIKNNEKAGRSSLSNCIHKSQIVINKLLDLEMELVEHPLYSLDFAPWDLFSKLKTVEKVANFLPMKMWWKLYKSDLQAKQKYFFLNFEVLLG